MPRRAAARIYKGTTRNLVFLAGRLQAGELVAVPTETVYGLAANALDPEACARIFRAKGRPRNDPLIVHLHSPAELPKVCQVNASALKLAKKFWPGPLTLVLPKKPAVPDIVTAGHSGVAVRVPSHRLFRALLARARLPLAAPSANLFGYISPTTATHVRDGLGNRIRHILDGGPARIGLESTILDLRDPRHPRLLRPGAVTRRELERVLHRRIVSAPRRMVGHSPVVLAPGQFVRHYSPRTPVVLHAKISQMGRAREAYVFIRRPARLGKGRVFWLDPKGFLPGAARRLFATLRKLDQMHFARIHVELAQGGGLAEAINDRLRRAAARNRRTRSPEGQKPR